MKRLLVCLDHSSRQSFVLRQAMELAEQARAEIVLLHVIEPAHGLTLPDAERQPGMQERVGDERRELMELASLVPKERLHGYKVAVGEPWRVICRTAQDYSVSYVVVGCHDGSLVEKAFGTTAEKVVRHCDRSVIVLRPTPRG